jgi:hypothetical protein
MTERIDCPREGYYRLRLIRGGLWVGVRIWRDSGHWRVEVDGRQVRVEGDHIVPLDVFEVWPWCCGQPISRREFDFLARRRDWARRHAPEHPAANPKVPIDLARLPPRF